MSDEPRRVGEMLVNGCLGALIAAMALYGAVAIVSSIWVVLCVIAAVVAAGWLGIWLLVSKYRRW